MAPIQMQTLLPAFLIVGSVVQGAPQLQIVNDVVEDHHSSYASKSTTQQSTSHYALTSTLPCSPNTVIVTATVTPLCPSSTIPTTTTSITSSTSLSSSSAPTPTPSGACLNVNPLCAANGFNIDYYFNMLGGYSNPYNHIFSNYYIVDKLSPLKSSLTNVTFFPQNQPPTSGAQTFPNSSIELVPPFTYTQFPSYAGYVRDTNGGIQVDANNFTLVYSGFFRPPTSGLWQICSSADNENDIYFGDGNAFGCLDGRPGTADDPIIKCSGGNFDNAQQCAKVTLTAGFFYPFRSVMANWQGPSAFEMTMVAPGQDTSAGLHDFSGHAYPNTCGLFL